MYKIGFYGGKFVPFHKGHKFMIDTALKECEEVWVILFTNGDDEKQKLSIGHKLSDKYLDVNYRIETVRKYCEEHGAHFGIVDCPTAYARFPNETHWNAEGKCVAEVIGAVPDAAYSSEPSYGAFFDSEYPGCVHRCVDEARGIVPISATAIRQMTDEEAMEWL